ncbi:hypothetical protein [Kitasatospora sp. NPDC059817]|uniref:hypothetical protein n=1 Tax=Kitasatospora sp. NPDC059817 TaxID=3346961 RepID=UPI00364F13D7
MPHHHVLSVTAQRHKVPSAPVAGQPTIKGKADDGCFVHPADLDWCDSHPSMRQQIGDYVAGTCPYLG